MASITQNGVAEDEPALSESILPLILLGLLVVSYRRVQAHRAGASDATPTTPTSA